MDYTNSLKGDSSSETRGRATCKLVGNVFPEQSRIKVFAWGWLTGASCIWRLSECHFSLSLTALPHTLPSWTDWRPHNSHYSMHFQTASLKLPLNVNHRHSQPKAVCLWLLAASVIDSQLMSLFFVVDWGQEHQGQQKSCLRVSITTSARAVMFLWAVCGKVWFVISR